jgi:hypothetical protein
MTSPSDSVSLEKWPPPMPTQRDKREAWLRLYRQRFVKVAGFTDAQANDAMSAVCTGPDDEVGFLELSEGWETDPEGAADEEMSYWDDDGE